jgi:hypothetical protein
MVRLSSKFLGVYYIGLNTILVYPVIQILIQVLMCSDKIKFKNSDHIDSCYSSMHAWMVVVAIFGLIFTLTQYIIVKFLLRELNPLVKSPLG